MYDNPAQKCLCITTAANYLQLSASTQINTAFAAVLIKLLRFS